MNKFEFEKIIGHNLHHYEWRGISRVLSIVNADKSTYVRIANSYNTVAKHNKDNCNKFDNYVKGDEFLDKLKSAYKVEFAREPNRSTIYSWFKKANVKYSVNHTYTKLELNNVISIALNSNLVRSYVN